MSIVVQISMFSWDEIDNLGDLERLRILIEHLPDETLLHALEKERGNGRNDYPVQTMWHAVLAGIIFQHHSFSSLIRELSRNAQLRWMCGFYPGTVPTDDAMGRFHQILINHEKDIRQMAATLQESIRKHLPDFGQYLAMDSKAVASLSNRESKKRKLDGRREMDAQFGYKEYRGVHPIIDKRSLWKDKESRQLRAGKNVSYTEDGSVYCYEDDTKCHLMANGGFDRGRGVLKKLCPAKTKGILCKHSHECDVKTGIRIKLPTDVRIFTSVDRTSHKWKRLYKMRSSAEDSTSVPHCRHNLTML